MPISIELRQPLTQNVIVNLRRTKSFKDRLSHSVRENILDRNG